MLAKGESLRLAKKNRKLFDGVPLFEINLRKLLRLFDEVVLDSDNDEILSRAEQLGAKARVRPLGLRGHSVSSVALFSSILGDFPLRTSMVNVQANSPNVAFARIQTAIATIEAPGVQEVYSVNADFSNNGSIWAMTRERVFDKEAMDRVEADVFLVDNSIDIHSLSDFNLALGTHLVNKQSGLM